jgi:protein tyrosine phosphatase (PTP) superfamily phosphohydrolase (DUF442 family)
MSSRPHDSVRTAVLLAVTCIVLVCAGAFGADHALQAPNVVPISASLVTSGQPSRDALAKLSAQGFGAVIYLAPPTVSDAVPGEADIVRQQGLEFVNIPIQFGNPTEADFQSFVEAMSRLRDRKVLVHCQVNMRASSMTFLYRVIIGREKPEQAYESVARVWSPDGPWRNLLIAQLHKAGIAFEPY